MNATQSVLPVEVIKSKLAMVQHDIDHAQQMLAVYETQKKVLEELLNASATFDVPADSIPQKSKRVKGVTFAIETVVRDNRPTLDALIPLVQKIVPAATDRIVKNNLSNMIREKRIIVDETGHHSLAGGDARAA